MLLVWIGLSWLLVVSQGRPETYLRATFAGQSRPDAFNGLNAILPYFAAVHSGWFLTGLSASWFRRSDVLVVLLIGPAMALGIGALSQQWSDPNWFVFVGVCQMGWIASTLVGLVYWGVRSKGGSA